MPEFSPQQHSMILWGVWLLTMAVFFSVASFFHQYYLSTLAPAVCALFGIGIVVMWQDYRRSGWRGWLLPLALLLTALEQIHIIVSNPSWGTWLIPLIAIPCAIAGTILIVARLMPRLRLGTRELVPALCTALLALMLTWAVWSAIPVLTNQAANLPVAGPSGQTSARLRGGTVRYFLLNGNGGGGPGGGQSALTTWIEQHATAMPSIQWQSSTSTSGGFGGGSQLYEITSSS